MDAYKMLNLRGKKLRGDIITNEMVKKNYLVLKENCLKMMEKHDIIKAQSESSRIKFEEAEEKLSRLGSEEVNAMMRGNYLELLQKAYETICTEEARATYEEEWQEMQKNQDAEKEQSEKNEQQANQAVEKEQLERNEQQVIQFAELAQSEKNDKQVKPAFNEQVEQQEQQKKEIQVIPIMTKASKQKTQMRKIKKRVEAINGKKVYTGPKVSITLTKPTIEEQQRASKDEIKFTPILTESSRQKIQEQQAKKMQQKQPTKEPLLKKILGMINNEKINTSGLIKEVRKNDSINKQKKFTIDKDIEEK